MGNIQAAIKKLLEQNLAAYEEFVENLVNKKRYRLTDAGEAYFLTWVQTATLAGKSKDMELSKLFFMGFVPAQKRQALIEAHLADLRKEREQLKQIQRRDNSAGKQEYMADMEKMPAQKNRLAQAAGQANISCGIDDIMEFQLLTLQLGIDRADFEIEWFTKLKDKLTAENKQRQNGGNSLKHIIITGANSACQEIREKTGNSDVNLVQLDIASRKSIHAFCEAYKRQYDVLDILINNAGHFNHGETRFQSSEDGLELTFATNLPGPALLTHLLLDMLAKSDTPMVLNACSTNIKHFFDERRKIDFKALRGLPVTAKKYNSYQLYGDSKIGLLMATFRMAQACKSYGIRVNAVMIPATKIAKTTVRRLKPCWIILATLQSPFALKAEVMGDAYFFHLHLPSLP